MDQQRERPSGSASHDLKINYGTIASSEPVVPQANAEHAPPQQRKKRKKSSRSDVLRHDLFVWFMAFVIGFLGGWLAFVSLGNQQVGRTVQTEVVREVLTEKDSDIAGLVETVGQSVVSIRVISGSDLSFFGGGESAGTGIIIDSDGLIMTNKHVVDSSFDELRVVLSDGSELSAELVDTDPLNDIAFIRASGGVDLQPATLGDSSRINVGQTVIAIGNALGEYQNTVTQGIISGKGRPVQASSGFGDVSSLQNLLQTDTAINPGNSGGPLINLAGEVIGINTAVANAENIGFAIPVNDAKAVLVSVQRFGEIRRPYIGVRYLTITPRVKSEYGLTVDQGAYLLSEGASAVISGSPAANAGLQDEDIILAVDGDLISDENTLQNLVAGKDIGESVQLEVLRGSETLFIELVLEQFTN